MPELPEMENYRRLLEQRIIGKAISQVEINREKSLNCSAEQFIAMVKGSKIQSVSRKGKNIFFHLNSGLYLQLHLMLGGWMFYSLPEQAPQRTKQVVLSFADGEELYFINLRLGYLHLLDGQAWQQELATLGPDIFSPEFTLEYFQKVLSKKRGYLKPVLVDQKHFCGLGNAYSDEICFAAKVRPDGKIASLSPEQLERVYQQMVPTLNRALSFGGYMEHPFYPGDNLTGGYNEQFYVYDREGEPCPNCSGSILRGEVTGRKFFYCPTCQST